MPLHINSCEINNPGLLAIVALFEGCSANPPYFSGKHKLVTRISKAISLRSLNQAAGDACFHRTNRVCTLFWSLYGELCSAFAPREPVRIDTKIVKLMRQESTLNMCNPRLKGMMKTFTLSIQICLDASDPQRWLLFSLNLLST